MNLRSFKLNNKECPSCLGNNLRTFSVKAHDSMPRGSLFDIIECIDCCFAWQWPIITSMDGGKHYFENAYAARNRDTYFDPEKRKQVSQMQFKFLTGLISKDKVDLLDIGAGDGTFIRVAADHGWNALGVDPARCEFHYDISHSKGFAEIICGHLDDIPNGKYFDVITLWDVLEHVEEPINILMRSIELLRNKGILIIETGNYQSGDRIVGNESWWCYQFDHRWYYCPPILKNILLELGLRKVEISSKTLRPWWNAEAKYICPSIRRVIKNIIKSPFRCGPIINNYIELRKAWQDWPHWVRNSIITIVATNDCAMR